VASFVEIAALSNDSVMRIGVNRRTEKKPDRRPKNTTMSLPVVGGEDIKLYITSLHVVIDCLLYFIAELLMISEGKIG